MPSSDLNKRLEHLISYSSQLIFINTGPQASGQSQTIDKLLAQQGENADIAMINALPEMQADDFCQQLGQQLLGGQTHHARQSIQQLLAPISQFTESVLICILHAQNLPETVVQECWQLILFHNKKLSEQNINILFFVDDNWTTFTKEYLAIDGPNQPVVLNILPYEAVAQDSELEQLISQKRDAFTQRLQERDASPELVTRSQLHQPWFWALTGLFFVSIFAVLLLIQYPQFPAKIMALMDDSVALSTNLDPTSESSTVSPAVVATNRPAKSPEDTDDHNDSDVTAPTVNTGDALVSSWQNETVRIDQAKVVRQIAAGTDKLAKEASSTEIPSGTKATVPENQTSVQVGVLGKPYTEQASTDNGAADQGTEQTVSLIKSTTQVTKNLSDAYYYNEQALLALTPDGYVLQIIGLSGPKVMDDYIQTNQLAPHVWIYKTRRYGNDWYVLLNNQYFSSLAEALQAVDAFPKNIGQTTPFPKSIEKVQQEIRNP
ncbi:MAG: DamX protein [Paraglaciecola sp.]